MSASVVRFTYWNRQYQPFGGSFISLNRQYWYRLNHIGSYHQYWTYWYWA